MSEEQDTPEVKQLRTSIENWLDGNQNRLEYNLTANAINFNRHSGSLFTGHGDQLAITIGFKDESIDETITLEQLRSKFNFIALDRLPLPGLQALPAKWQIYPQTPVSSFSDGVTLETYDTQTNTLKINVKTKFFAIYGSIPPEHPMGCGRAPPGTYLQVRRDIECNLTFTAKLHF